MSEQAASQPRTIWAWALGTFLGVGLPNRGKGMGTVASAVTLLLWLGVVRVVHADAASISVAAGTAAAALVVTLLGIPASTICEREMGTQDPPQVVLDEVAGQLIALVGAAHDWKYLLAAFILFRGFDMLKPPPVSQAERAPGGLGIMLDDVVAGLLALVVLRLVHHFGVI